jgi:hypothetical protein
LKITTIFRDCKPYSLGLSIPFFGMESGGFSVTPGMPLIFRGGLSIQAEKQGDGDDRLRSFGRSADRAVRNERNSNSPALSRESVAGFIDGC